MKKLTKIVLVASLTLSAISPSYAATEINDDDFGPTYNTMIADAVAGKPLGALAVVTGAAAWLVSLPFTLLTGDTARARQTLIDEPFYALDRCLGCTPAEDRYYKAQQPTNNQMVRVTVDGPSEILINTNQNVIVKAP